MSTQTRLTDTEPRFATAFGLSILVVVLTGIASGIGLFVDGVYSDTTDVVATLRAGDLINLVAAIPILLVVLWRVRTGSAMAHVAWVAMLAYVVYSYAFQVFGITFNDLFLVHVGTFAVAMVALGFAAGSLDPSRLETEGKSRVLARVIAGLLVLFVGFMVASYGGQVIEYNRGGMLPADALPLPEWRVHLGYALDLSLIAPTGIIAAALLWRGRPWGYALSLALLTFLTLFQVTFLAIAMYMDTAGVAGADAAVPQAISAFVVFAIPLAVLWRSVVKLQRDSDP